MSLHLSLDVRTPATLTPPEYVLRLSYLRGFPPSMNIDTIFEMITCQTNYEREYSLTRCKWDVVLDGIPE